MSTQENKEIILSTFTSSCCFITDGKKKKCCKKYKTKGYPCKKCPKIISQH